MAKIEAYSGAPVWGANVVWVAVFAAITAVVFWPVLGINYSQDDWYALAMAVNAPLMPRTPLPFWRPIEGVIIWATANSGLALHKLVSVLVLAITARLCGLIAKRIWGPPGGWLAAAFVLVAPLTAMAIYQVDTVSQMMAGLFALLMFHQIEVRGPAASGNWRLVAILAAAFAALAILSKETAFGVTAVPVGIFVLTRLHSRLADALGKRTIGIPVAITAVIAVNFWARSLLMPGDIVDTDVMDSYALRPSAVDTVQRLAMLIGGNFVAAPSSRLLGAPDHLDGLDYGGVAIGLILAAGLGGALIRQASRLQSDARRLPVLVVLYLLGSTVPAVIYHASELYAFQVLPFLAILAGALLAKDTPKVLRWAAPIVGLMFAAASLRAIHINAAVLSNNYAYSEYLRCQHQMPGNCAATASTDCTMDRAHWLQIRGSPAAGYSLYYGPLEDYFAEDLVPPRLDVRGRVPICRLGPLIPTSE